MLLDKSDIDGGITLIIFKLKELMDKNNLSIADVHKITGISRSSLTPLINTPEDVKAIRTETIDKLCSLFGVHTSDLIEFIPERAEINIQSLLHTKYVSRLTHILYDLNFQIGFLKRTIFVHIKSQYFPDNSQLFVTAHFIEKPLVDEIIKKGEITGEFNHSGVQNEGYEFIANLNTELFAEVTDNLVKLTSEILVDGTKDSNERIDLVSFNWEKTETLSFPFPHKTFYLYRVTKNNDEYEISDLY